MFLQLSLGWFLQAHSHGSNIIRKMKGKNISLLCCEAPASEPPSEILPTKERPAENHAGNTTWAVPAPQPP